MRIAVFTGSSQGLALHREDAATFGRELAEAGVGIVYGGAHVGLMGVVADSALAAGGEVVGVMPQHLVDREVALVMNTPKGKGARTDEGKIRAAAVQSGVPCVTTIEAATAAVKAIEALGEEEMQVEALQDRFR